MADRRNYYHGQVVEGAELNAGFTGLENADRNVVADLALVGVTSGLTVAESVPAALTVQVGGPGAAYDQSGRRCFVPGTQVVDCTIDSLGASTAVASAGNKKIVSVFVKFARANSDPRTTGDTPPQEVDFVSNETFSFWLVQSAEGVDPVLPALLSDGVLLADVTRSFEQTQIVAGDINIGRRQTLTATEGSPHSLTATTIKAGFAQLLAYLNVHISGDSDRHTSLDIETSKVAATEVGQPDLGDYTDRLEDTLKLLRLAQNIWAPAIGALVADTVAAQLAALETNKAALAGATFTGGVTHNALVTHNGNIPALSGAVTVTRRIFPRVHYQSDPGVTVETNENGLYRVKTSGTGFIVLAMSDIPDSATLIKVEISTVFPWDTPDVGKSAKYTLYAGAAMVGLHVTNTITDVHGAGTWGDILTTNLVPLDGKEALNGSQQYLLRIDAPFAAIPPDPWVQILGINLVYAPTRLRA